MAGPAWFSSRQRTSFCCRSSSSQTSILSPILRYLWQKIGGSLSKTNSTEVTPSSMSICKPVGTLFSTECGLYTKTFWWNELILSWFNNVDRQITMQDISSSLWSKIGRFFVRNQIRKVSRGKSFTSMSIMNLCRRRRWL